MKKIVILIVMLIAFISISQQAHTCPYGWEQKTLYGTYQYNGNFVCNVTIVFCCIWDPNTHTVLIEIDYIESTDDVDCLRYLPNPAHFLIWLHQFIVSNSEDLCLEDIPPCDHPTLNYYTVSISRAACLIYSNEFVSPAPGEEPVWKLRMRKCSSDMAKCVSTWRICLDYNFSPPHLVQQLISVQLVGQPTCEEGTPTLPPNGKTWFEEWETDCFLYSCE